VIGAILIPLALLGLSIYGILRSATTTLATRPAAHPTVITSVQVTQHPGHTASPVLPSALPVSSTGSGAFTVDWTGTNLATARCPAGHATATCYTATASGTIPVLGRVSLVRSIAAGDGQAIAPSGCVNATTDGTLLGTTGQFTFHADGLLCGKSSAYTVTSSRGTGSVGGYQLHGQILTNAGSEIWSGQLVSAS